MVLHIKNYALHGLISPRDHRNVNHLSSLRLSNICMKSLTHHLRAQRYYTNLLYRAKETNRTTYWANEPMEGVVFDVQDHTRQTGTRGPIHMGRWLARTSMGLKSSSYGCWDGRGRTMSWWSLAWRRQKDTLTRTLWQRFDLEGITPCRWDDGFDGQDATQGRLDVFWRMWQCAWTIWHVWQPAEALEGPTFFLLNADDAQKGPTSPSEGPGVSFF